MQQDRGHRGKELTHTGTETNFCSGACLGMKTFLASDIHPPPGAPHSFRNPCAAEKQPPWELQALWKCIYMLNSCTTSGHRGMNTVFNSLAMAEPPPAILQGLQPHWLLHRAPERWGRCSAQAWLNQEFPLFSYTISSLWVLTDSFRTRSSLSRKWVGQNPRYSQFCF